MDKLLILTYFISFLFLSDLKLNIAEAKAFCKWIFYKIKRGRVASVFSMLFI